MLLEYQAPKKWRKFLWNDQVTLWKTSREWFGHQQAWKVTKVPKLGSEVPPRCSWTLICRRWTLICRGLDPQIPMVLRDQGLFGASGLDTTSRTQGPMGPHGMTLFNSSFFLFPRSKMRARENEHPSWVLGHIRCPIPSNSGWCFVKAFVSQMV